MKFLFLNALKGLKNHKLQITVIAVLIFLSTGIYTMINLALDRIESRYYTYLDNQNVEDFAFISNINYEKEINNSKINLFLNNELKNINAEDKKIILLYSNCLNKKEDYCNEYLYYQVNNIFYENNLFEKINKEKFDSLAKNYNFDYEKTNSKIIKDNDITIKAFPYNNTKKINIPYILEGSFPKKNNEITILKGYAKKNNLKLGDIYKINKKEYRIVGYAYASDHIYPMLSINSLIFLESKNNIVFVTEDEYLNLAGIEEVLYSAKFNTKSNSKNRMEIEIEENTDGRLIAKTSNPATNLLVKEQNVITRDMNTIFRTVRIDTMKNEIESNRIFSLYFLYLLLIISVIIIIIINKKTIEAEKIQIGILKSLGYKRLEIAISYLVYPLIGSLVGGTFGFLLGYLLNDILAKFYLSYFNMVLSENIFNLTYLLKSIFIPLVFLSILTFLTSLIMLRKNPLILLKDFNNLKVNALTKFINFLTRRMHFKKRFRYSLALRSISKLLVVSFTSFITGLLITLVLVGGSLFSNIINESFSSIKFNYMVFYNKVENIETNDDSILQTLVNVTGVKDKNEQKRNLEKDFSITLNGIDSNLKYLTIIDKEKNDLTKELTDQTIIINENVKKLLNVKIGDYLIISLNNKEYSYEIVGITNSYIGNTCYTKKDKLNELLGFEDESYNLKYTSEEKYKNISKLPKEEISKIGMVLSFDELRDSIKASVKTYSVLIYIIIIFALIMALIIILVIANIVIDENRKIISLMKIMGYKNKEISKIIINIYTPFIIVFYLLSFFCMTNILKVIVNILENNIGIAIPVSIKFYQLIIGLIIVLVTYFIAIKISEKALNKIPLSIALKKE